MDEKIKIYKSDKVYEKKNPWIVIKGDIRASFKTKEEAEDFAKNEMPKYYRDPITFDLKKEGNWRKSKSKMFGIKLPEVKW